VTALVQQRLAWPDMTCEMEWPSMVMIPTTAFALNGTQGNDCRYFIKLMRSVVASVKLNERKNVDLCFMFTN